MSKKKIFIFDVDGVIVDSTDECLVVAWNAYLNYSKSTKSKISMPEEAEESYAKHFRSIRNYVRSMDEYLLVFNTTLNEITSQEKYEEKLSNLNKKDKDLYGEYFFESRKLLKRENKEQWLSLHHIYDGVIDLFKKIQSKFNVYIVTGKDKESVIDFLNYFRIEFSSNKIYDKSIAKNKLIALEEIAKIENIPNEDIFFLDDNVTHLVMPHKKGFNTILAKWGYGQKEHFALAKKNKILALEITSIYKKVIK